MYTQFVANSHACCSLAFSLANNNNNNSVASLLLVLCFCCAFALLSVCARYSKTLVVRAQHQKTAKKKKQKKYEKQKTAKQSKTIQNNERPKKNSNNNKFCACFTPFFFLHIFFVCLFPDENPAISRERAREEFKRRFREGDGERRETEYKERNASARRGATSVTSAASRRSNLGEKGEASGERVSQIFQNCR